MEAATYKEKLLIAKALQQAAFGVGHERRCRKSALKRLEEHRALENLECAAPLLPCQARHILPEGLAQANARVCSCTHKRKHRVSEVALSGHEIQGAHLARASG